MNKSHGARKQLPLSAVKYLIILIVLVAVVLVTLSNTDILAKYVYGQENDLLLAAKNFYFESDYLFETGSGTNSNHTLQEGVNTISFELRNYPDTLRYSEVDIEYSVTLKGPDNETKTVTGTLKGNKQSNTVITFENLTPGTYTVTATSSPYSKTLVGTFKIREALSNVSYTVNDNSGSPFLEVVVTTTDYSGNIKITLPEGVRPDNTDPLLSSATGSTCTVNMNSYSSYSFLFFKDNPSAVFTKSNFEIEKLTS